MIAIPLAAAVFLAIVCLVILFGVQALSKLLSQTLGHVPVVGSTISSALDGWIKSTVGGLAKWLFSSSWSGLHFLAAPFDLLRNLIGGAITAIQGAIYSISQLYHAVANAMSQARSDLTTAVGTIDQTITAQGHWLAGEITTASSDLTRVITAQGHWLAGEITTASSDLTRVITAQGHWLAGEITTVEAAAAAGLAALGDYTEAAIGETQRAATAGLTALGTWTEGQIDRLRTDIVQTGAASDQYTRDAVAASEGATLGYIGAQVLPAVDALTAEVDECVRPYCAMQATAARDFSTLLSLVLDGVMLGFLAAAIATPTGTAEATVVPLTSVVGSGAEVIEDLIRAA